jgi:hypothetical protein
VAEVQVLKAAAVVPIVDELLAAGQGMSAGLNRWMAATPEERDQWARDLAAQRAAERAAAAPAPFTLAGLLDKLGFSCEYAEHLVQPYCNCEDTNDGWDYCQHARDLGLTA